MYTMGTDLVAVASFQISQEGKDSMHAVHSFAYNSFFFFSSLRRMSKSNVFVPSLSLVCFYFNIDSLQLL